MTPARPRKTDRSHEVLARSMKVFPGGVSSPVRAFRGVGGEPFVVGRGLGSRIWDLDGNEYIDYVLSWGPLVLGHAHPAVIDSIDLVMRGGTSFGIPTRYELELAELVVARMPHIEMMRLVSSGTEATMSAVRLARAATGRSAILKFDGCYHGHGDSFLVRAGSGVATLGLPNSPGVPPELAALTLTASFNDLAEVDALLAAHDVAAIIVEPVVGNGGFIPPDAGFLAGLREIATRRGALLIFDEVMTGFRVAYGVRRPARPHGAHRAARSGLSSRHALGQSDRNGSRDRDVAAAHAGAPRYDRRPDHAARRGASRRRRESGRSVQRRIRGVDVGLLLPRRGGAHVR
jgi:glutamate-1-semialdehyde 2,1-aminomutase